MKKKKLKLILVRYYVNRISLTEAVKQIKDLT
jgi:hypothetical protein